jgi:hypothetical protein
MRERRQAASFLRGDCCPLTRRVCTWEQLAIQFPVTIGGCFSKGNPYKGNNRWNGGVALKMSSV